MEDESIKKSRVAVIIVVILVILLGTWGWVKYGDKISGGSDTPTDVVGEDNADVVRINAKHQWKDGKHIIAGEVDMPTPCHVLNTDTTVAESMPEQVTVAFTLTSGTDMCAQVITTERFKVEFSASKDAVIKATWNGSPAILNLIPAGPNEDLTNFEIFIKG